MNILRPRNWKLEMREDAEVVMTLDVLEAHSYAMTAADALRLSRELEAMAKVLVRIQVEELAMHERQKGAPGKTE